MSLISPKAEVANPAALASDVRVGAFTLIGPDVTVGAGTVIHNNVTLTGVTRVGADCEIFPGAVVGCAAAHTAGGGRCVIGDENTIREHVIIEAGESPDSPGTQLAHRNLLMVGCQIGHDASLADEGIFANFTRIDPFARIEEFVRTSGFTFVADHAAVGAYTFTTGYARIESDAPPFAIMQGLPILPRTVNSENLRRCGFDADVIAHTKAAFRILFAGDEAFPSAEKLAEVEASFSGDAIAQLIESIRLAAASPTGRRLAPAEAR